MRQIEVRMGDVPLYDQFKYNGIQYRKYRNGIAVPVYIKPAKAIKITRCTKVQWVHG